MNILRSLRLTRAWMILPPINFGTEPLIVCSELQEGNIRNSTAIIVHLFCILASEAGSFPVSTWSLKKINKTHKGNKLNSWMKTRCKSNFSILCTSPSPVASMYVSADSQHLPLQHISSGVCSSQLNWPCGTQLALPYRTGLLTASQWAHHCQKVP